MSRSRMWYLDGTFKSRPLLFAQLYCVHYDYQDHVIPGVFVLMSDKTQRSYADVFMQLRNELPDGHQGGPQFFSTDFELAAANAFKETFGNAGEAFCFFHFAQSLQRKLQESRHSAAYLQEENVVLRTQFHAILNLCFVPPDDVGEVFLLIHDSCEDELDEVLDHLEVNYVLGRRRGRGRQQPRFAISKQNLYDRVINGLPRTNNTCEAQNNRLNLLLGKQHPNLYEFLEALLKEELYAESKRLSVDVGEPPERKKRKYLRNDARIERIVGRYTEYKDEQEGLLEGDWDNGLLKYLKTLGHSARGVFQRQR